MSAGRDEYIHGTARDEQDRLATLNRLLNRQSLARLLPRPGERVLDVGCGFGLFAEEIAAHVGPTGRVVGIEREAAQIEEGKRLIAARGAAPRAEIRQGDAYHFPLRDDEWGTFDIAHARFLLEHLARPGDVVASMVRAVRPGGRIILEDDDHAALILHPPIPEFEAVWSAYARSYDASGRDARIGRKLVSLLAGAGASPVRCDWPFFGACAGSETFDVIIANCRAILVGARDTIVSTGNISAEDFAAGLRAYDAWRGRPDASYWYCTFWAEGVRRD
ncbi:MAG TPA: methyltransferase domain-containing protein [Candidatus Krumholzibacteria bacterium]